MLALYLTYFALSAYAVLTLFILAGWISAILKSKKRNSTYSPASILIACRNEEKRLGPLILSIKILSERIPSLEFIFINDHSTDQTQSLLEEEFQGFENTNIHVLEESVSGKKSAISKGISIAKYNQLIITDADCELTENAVLSMLCNLENKQTKMVCGPVFQYSGKGLAARLVDLEFMSLIGSGISFWGLGFPFMGNAAFMGIKKQAFASVNGFDGNEQFPGGDDVFLIQKIEKHFGPKSIQFLTESTSLIQTQGDISLRDFIQRRIRWGAKAKAYQSWFSKLISVSVFVCNSLLLVSYFITTISFNLPLFFYTVLIKLALDIVLLSAIVLRFKKWGLVPYIFPASVFHPFYIVGVGALAFAGKYTWKERDYRHQTKP